ncbi:hypothetical protein LIA77_03734 [Sarocladium implicatum]|nr:hypothetical protein LIA77_03734 [Sarocladium implicatum]
MATTTHSPGSYTQPSSPVTLCSNTISPVLWGNAAIQPIDEAQSTLGRDLPQGPNIIRLEQSWADPEFATRGVRQRHMGTTGAFLFAEWPKGQGTMNQGGNGWFAALPSQ